MIAINIYLYSYFRSGLGLLIFYINGKLFMGSMQVYHFYDVTTWPLEFWKFQNFQLDIYFKNLFIY